MNSYIDRLYGELVSAILMQGEYVRTRNSGVYRLFVPDVLRIDEFPLVQLRKTAYKKALREMEWFMSGDTQCPVELQDWWAGQLNEDMRLIDGYGTQLRRAPHSYNGYNDQIRATLGDLRDHPFSRRILITTWNPGDMAAITENNDNPNTPTCCHATMIQYSVSADQDGKPKTLNAYHFQRSADVLLGLPHNLVQHWALLTFFAHHAGLKVGRLAYQLGDAHLYDEQSHLQAAQSILRWTQGYNSTADAPTLVYKYGGEVDELGVPTFKASDFSVEWPEGVSPSEPLTKVRPKLL